MQKICSKILNITNLKLLNINHVFFNKGILYRKLYCQKSSNILKSQNISLKQYKYKNNNASNQNTISVLFYVTSIGVFMFGMAYAGVPLYRLFCQATGYGGEVKKSNKTKVEDLIPIKDRQLKVRFNADTGSTMMWNFRPQQKEIKLYPGETALAFYKAKNPTNVPVIGVSTYNVVPFEAGPYFNKIQCFCFEEQRLNPHEEVDMPVFFYIDPEFCDDPLLDGVSIITLSYTFFEAKDGLELVPPSYASPHVKQTQ